MLFGSEVTGKNLHYWIGWMVGIGNYHPVTLRTLNVHFLPFIEFYLPQIIWLSGLLRWKL
jgi:hypothetical protein